MTDKDLEKGNLEEDVKETEIPAEAEEVTAEAAAEEPAAPPAPSAEEVLLTEIRDLLKNK